MVFAATIITSLPPTMKRMVGGRDFGAVYQRACIESWVSAGFRVTSINSAVEIEQLKPLGYPVRYVLSSNVRPAIEEFLDYAGRCQDDLVGIINADCFFLGYPSFVGGIKTGALRGVVMVERVNIDPISLLPTGQTCLGFDAFFFTPSMARLATVPPDLSVGQPWWDYWLPAAFAVENIELLRPQSPLVFHLDHEQGWSQERWLKTGRSFLQSFADLDDQKFPSFLTEVRRFASWELASREDLGGFGHWCFNWLRDNASYLEVSAEPTADELLGRILASVTNFDGMHANTLALAEARNNLAAALAEARNNLAALTALQSQVARGAVWTRQLRLGAVQTRSVQLYWRARRFSGRLIRAWRKAT
ncbi:hypothetical protein [Bradyrhizobium diazoefficiens]|uniref:hypothetical protein n=1 Tax=Bradyrhizobium diazoefficiens TaxID=1355477 RepID=UPI00272D2F12|nr:hypothetical protein [Bradyrhizobium diazoefficiens]WLA68029.1 hypothetical protein QNN01_15960 [Bradyrhizobium diazoefficiens]